MFGDFVEPGLHLTGPALLSNRDLLFIIRDLGGRNLACGKQTPELGGAHGIGCQNRIIAEPIESARPRPSADVKRADFRHLMRALFGHHCEYSRSKEHTSKLQSLMRNSYAVFCLQKK